MKDLIVIGAGPAGMTTAMYASRAGLDVGILERGLYGGQLNNTDLVENYTAFTLVSGEELSNAMESQSLAQEGLEHIYGDVNTVTQINKGFEIHTDDDIIESKSIAIATGVKYKTLGVEGEELYDGDGISYCCVCDGNFFKGKHVAVIGGGDSAVEASIYLSNIVDKVTLIHRRDKLRAEEILQERMFEKDNIEYIWDAQVESFDSSSEEGLEFVKYRDKNNPEKVISLPVDGAFIYVGIEPTTKTFRDLGINNSEGFIITDDKMSTPMQGVFAVGDVRADSIRQVVTATGDGAVASDSIVRYLRGV